MRRYVALVKEALRRPGRCAIASTGKMPVGPTAKMAVLRTRLDQSVPAVFERVMFSIITAGG